MNSDKNGVKWTFLLIVQTKTNQKATKHKQNEANKTEKKPKERHQNTLLVPTSREVGSVQQPFLLIIFSSRFK